MTDVIEDESNRDHVEWSDQTGQDRRRARCGVTRQDKAAVPDRWRRAELYCHERLAQALITILVLPRSK